MRRPVIAMLALWLLTGASTPRGILTRHALSGSLAEAVARRAVAACAERGFDVGAAVADANGSPRALVMGDNVSALSVETAVRKAKAAALNGYRTSKLAEATSAAPAYAAMLRTIHPDMLFLAGAVPIQLNGELLGAIGVGGASDGANDERCAADAVAQTPELSGR